MKLNKKASLFHWVVFAVMAALSFFVFNVNNNLNLDSPGEWQIQFYEFYQKVDVQNLYLEKVALYSSNKFVIDSAKTFGFNSSSSCGDSGGFYLLNNGAKFCKPNIIDFNNAEINLDLSLFKDTELNFKTELLDHDYTTKLTNSNIAGYSDKEIIFTDKTSKGFEDQKKVYFYGYKIKPSFSIEYGFNISGEYISIGKQANKLIINCRGNPNLNDCISSNKDSNWLDPTCGTGSPSGFGKNRHFCVVSPSNARLFNPTTAQMENLRYNLALDFN